jgi:hypothetical protein
LVGLDDVPEGIVSSGGAVDARGERVVATARGALVSPDGQNSDLELGVLSVGVTYAYAGSSAREVEVRTAARREAAWRAGQGMAERAMGYPRPSDPRPDLRATP